MLPTDDKEIVTRLLSADEEYENFFFSRQCIPLLSKIRWSIFDNEIEIEELISEFILLLKSDDWKKLRSFGFRCSLFGWLRIVAINHFNSIRDDLLPHGHKSNKTELNIIVPQGKENDIKKLINTIQTPMYKEILIRSYINIIPLDELIPLLSLTKDLFFKLRSRANKQLIKLIKNEGDEFAALYLKNKDIKQQIDIETTYEIEVISNRMDAETLIKSLSNDRFRFVLDSLILKNMNKSDVAKIMGTSVEYIDTLKHRAIKQIIANVKVERAEYGTL